MWVKIGLLLLFLVAVTHQQDCELIADVVLVVDGSGSIRDTNPPDNAYDNWELLLGFLQDLVKEFNIARDKVRVGLVIFDNFGNVKWGLDQYDNVDNLVRAIAALLDEYEGGNTNTQDGIKKMRTEVFTQAGDRDNVPNIAIIITDGRSTINRNETVPQAELAMDEKIILFSIGVTNSVDEDELKAISSPPQERNKNFFTSASFSALDTIISTVVEETCTIITPGPDPTQTTTPATDPNCARARADIVFIVDGSGSIRKANPPDGAFDNWELLLDFINDIVEKLPIGPDNVHVGLVLFSHTGDLRWDLSAHKDSASLMAAITDLINHYPDSNTNTQEGISVARTQVFGNEGDRAGIPNIAIVITDGKSTINPEETIPQAELLRADGAEIFAIGVTSDVDENELKGMSSMPQERNKNYFTAADFTVLDTVLNVLLTETCFVDCKSKADVVFILDSSGSIDEQNFEKAKTFIASIMDSVEFKNDHARIGLVQFSTNVELAFHLNQYNTKEDVKAAILRLEFLRGTTNTAGALDYVQDTMFTSANGDREDIPNFAITITDGGSNDKAATIDSAFSSKAKGIHNIAIGVGSWLNEQELRAIASYPYSKNMILVDDYDSLSEQSGKLADYICNNYDECEGKTCSGNGQCSDGIDTYICICNEGYAGIDCEKSCRNPADVSFSLDASGSIGPTNFLLMSDFTQSIILDLPVGSGGNFALQTFASEFKNYFHFKDYNFKFSVLNHFAIPYLNGGSTNTAAALTNVRTMYNSANGAQSSTPNVAVIFTDGLSNEPTATAEQASLTRKEGIHIIAVGVGDKANEKELNMTASYPSQRNVYMVPDFNSLESFKNDLVDAICNNDDNCNPNPCSNGNCVDQINGYYCECNEGWTGHDCDMRYTRTSKLDLVLVVDNSGSIRRERFRKVQDFLVNLVNTLDMRNDNVRIGMVVFDTNPKLQFKLNTYDNKKDVIDGIYSTEFGAGRTNIYDALKMVKEEVLITSAGDREDVQNTIIVFSDGNANINEDKTLEMATTLKIDGSHIISTAVGTDLNMLELYGIASDTPEANVMTVKSFSDLKSMENKVMTSVYDPVNSCDSNPCQNGAECRDMSGKYICMCPRDNTGVNCQRVCRNQMDVVIILDLSGSLDLVRNITIEFAKEAIMGMDIDSDRVRVGVVWFSSDSHIHWYLNTHDSKQDMLTALTFRKVGGLTNTVSALEKTRDSVLVNSRGARDGVPDYVIVVTDGGSNIEAAATIPRAQDLKDNGATIHVIAVGEDVDMNEVNGMASQTNSPYVIRVPTKNDVQNGVNTLLDHLCA